MGRQLDVLVIESQRGAGRAAARDLEAAGHRIVRCFGEHDSGFPCRGVAEPGTCPIEGPVDAALLVRRHATPRPTPLEQGVTCAVRAGVPVVEVAHRTAFDPFDGWLAAHAEPSADVVAAVERTAGAASDELGRAVLAVIAPRLVDEGLDPAAVTCTAARDDERLHLRIGLPVETDASLRHALAVRALSAVRGLRGERTAVGIAVSCPTASAA